MLELEKSGMMQQPSGSAVEAVNADGQPRDGDASTTVRSKNYIHTTYKAIN